jgi:hypothetical protein
LTIHGLTGLVRVPTAEMPADGTMTFAWMPSQGKESAAMGATATHGVTVQARPNLEGTYALGRTVLHNDITISGKYALTGPTARTAVAVGVVDLKRTGFGEPTYFAVATRRFADGRVAVTLGGAHGGSSGLIGGVSARVADGVDLQAEYDARRLNTGVAVRVGDKLTLHAVDLDAGVRVSTCYATALATPDGRSRRATSVPASSAPPSAVAAEAQAALVALGFEDVRTALTPDGTTLAAQYENRRYTLSEADGFAAALEALAASAPASVTTLRAVATRRGLPVSAVTVPADGYRRYLSGVLTSEAMARTTDVRILPDGVTGPAANRSVGHTDILVGPGLATLLGTGRDTLATGWYARAEAVVVPVRGVQAMARVAMPLGGKLVKDESRIPKVDRAQLMVAARLGSTALVQAHAGRFQGERDGVALEMAAPVGRAGLFHVVAATTERLGARQRCLVGDYRWALPAQHLQVRLVGGRFLDGDRGAGIDVLRFYRELAVGLGMRETQHARLMEIRVVTPLSPRRQLEAPRGLRVRTPDVFDYRMRSLVIGSNYLLGAQATATELALAGDLAETVFDRGRGTEDGVRSELYRQ